MGWMVAPDEKGVMVAPDEKGGDGSSVLCGVVFPTPHRARVLLFYVRTYSLIGLKVSLHI